MSVKHEWRKHEKGVYLPKNKPEIIAVPEYKFITFNGQGNPNGEAFSEAVSILYSVAYALKMQLKKRDSRPQAYTDFTVYPLEGVWDITETAKRSFNGEINKDELIYTLMIRQPDFINQSLFDEILAQLKVKNPSSLLESVKFTAISEGLCIQMLHLGRFEDEHISFSQMESFANAQGLSRLSKEHREIYLTDARRVSPDKYKTVLRFKALPTVVE